MTKNTVRKPIRPRENSELQALLTALPGNVDNVYHTNEWVFQDNRQNIYTVSFTLVEKVAALYPEWVQKQGTDPVSLAKQLWLSLAERTGISNYVKTFRGMLLWIAALANNNTFPLTRSMLPELLRFRLTHTISVGGIYPAKSLVSDGSLTTPSLLRLQEVCDDSELDWFGRSITNHYLQGALKKLIPELTDNELTYQDWRQGHSFNLLTLDYGRYYVEHCLNVFEEHSALAIALRRTQRDEAKIAELLNIGQRTLNTRLCQILEGHKAEDIDPQYPSYILRIQEAVLDHFRSVYRQARFEHELLRETTLEEVAEKFNLSGSQENVDRLRVIFWDWLQRGNRTETERLLTQCQTAIPWSLFEETMESVQRHFDDMPLSMPSPEFFQNLGFSKIQDGGVSNINSFVAWVAKAGVTSIVALTGWRRSEFGFPWSAIQQIRNKDKLDEYAFPYRYQIDWYVKKTNGKVRTLREITFGTISLIDRVRHLNESENELPSLYSINSNRKDPFKSETAIDSAVITLWPHFVHHYGGFRLLDDLESWRKLMETEKSQKLLTVSQHREKERLLALQSRHEWDTIVVDENLRTAWRQARSDWPRLAFIWSKNTKANRDWVVQYRQGMLREDWTRLLDYHLSDETKVWFFSLDAEELRTNKEIGRTLSREVMAEALYPSPHAFRHMWAESVYRRFDGDAGWIIRSQFKHISRRMWLSYIRNKDNRFILKSVKLHVTHSLVVNFLKHKGEGYAGQMTTFLRRLFQKTKVLSPEEQQELANKLATQEIESLKSNPWGYCLLMRRSRHKANCAQGSEPMSHNASPDLCLGCIHNLMQANNVEWMIFHVSAHVEALMNPIVPNIFKKASYDLVVKTTRQVRRLNASHEALPELEEALLLYERRAD
ncbi:hypothetical protein [Marinobacter xestospongiae]|uniref:Phage integrase family protein n=1 Tax=Marinobacter xestospongiae TaxID=994319 RepID=A0ABU3W1G9_9GAMM|nr:hypothetical protein [Marinobacter xestospongiae]MDV2080383.1 hypothetical protein [Marinobacter xestospongiae]